MEVIGTVAVRRFAQLLLIVLLALGVVWMHTLGHFHDQGVPADGAVTHLVSAASPVMAAPHAAMVAAVATPPATVKLSTAKPPMPPTDPMRICLAVLTAVGFAVALVALLAARRIGIGIPATGGPAWTISARGPPRRIPSTARRLAILSVLRT